MTPSDSDHPPSFVISRNEMVRFVFRERQFFFWLDAAGTFFAPATETRITLSSLFGPPNHVCFEDIGCNFARNMKNMCGSMVSVKYDTGIIIRKRAGTLPALKETTFVPAIALALFFTKKIDLNTLSQYNEVLSFLRAPNSSHSSLPSVDDRISNFPVHSATALTPLTSLTSTNPRSSSTQSFPSYPSLPSDFRLGLI